ncbi:hypothetical protein C0993_002694 [Termitomyces sp. T159_Od127]|nr:hypothetical protein C0993_002694 [Termitomyces sp. T159_Od127]
MPETTKQEPVLLALQVLAPSRRTRSARNTRKIQAPPAYTASTPNKQENVYPSTFFATPPESTTTPASTPTPLPSEQYTGDWKVDAIAAVEYLHTSERIHITEKRSLSVPPPPSKKADADLSPIRSQPLSPRRTHLLSRSRQRFNPPSKQSDSLRTSSKSTPSAPRKRAKLLRDKDGKPVMACLFCRGRKIACGPPPQGSDDPTCK